MRLFLTGMCALVAVGVFAVMFISIWGTRRAAAATPTAWRQSFATELVWAAIPCLMIIAAAVPAVIAIASRHTGE